MAPDKADCAAHKGELRSKEPDAGRHHSGRKDRLVFPGDPYQIIVSGRTSRSKSSPLSSPSSAQASRSVQPRSQASLAARAAFS